MKISLFAPMFRLLRISAENMVPEASQNAKVAVASAVVMNGVKALEMTQKRAICLCVMHRVVNPCKGHIA